MPRQRKSNKKRSKKKNPQSKRFKSQVIAISRQHNLVVQVSFAPAKSQFLLSHLNVFFRIFFVLVFFIFVFFSFVAKKKNENQFFEFSLQLFSSLSRSSRHFRFDKFLFFYSTTMPKKRREHYDSQRWHSTHFQCLRIAILWYRSAMAR